MKVGTLIFFVGASMHILRMFGVLLAALLLFCGSVSAAQRSPPPAKKESASPLTLLKSTTVDVPLGECERRDTCDLRRLLFVTEDYRLKIGKDEYQYFTLTYATYETATFATLEKYAFVQFIRGSVFTSRKDPVTGKTEVTYDGALGNFDQWLVYKIPEWIIDAGSTSPTYMSIEGMPQHYWYRWQNAILPPPWLTQDENIYRQDRSQLKVPRLYVDDNPQEALVVNGTAYNVSLEFKTCLYKSADIPKTTTRDNTNFAEPLFCFPWRSSYVYNHDLKKYESPEGLVFPGLTGENVLIIIGDKMKRPVVEE